MSVFSQRVRSASRAYRGVFSQRVRSASRAYRGVFSQRVWSASRAYRGVFSQRVWSASRVYRGVFSQRVWSASRAYCGVFSQRAWSASRVYRSVFSQRVRSASRAYRRPSCGVCIPRSSAIWRALEQWGPIKWLWTRDLVPSQSHLADRMSASCVNPVSPRRCHLPQLTIQWLHSNESDPLRKNCNECGIMMLTLCVSIQYAPSWLTS